MNDRLIVWIDRIADIKLRDQVELYLSKYNEDFLIWPASINHHHAYEGGLLDHTLEVVNIAYSIALDLRRGYLQTTELNLDEVIMVALLHDIGKLNEYGVVAGRWTHTGFLIHHSTWVLMDWNRIVGHPMNERMFEAFLTHHGGWSPHSDHLKNPLSAIIHSADLISSRLKKDER